MLRRIVSALLLLVVLLTLPATAAASTPSGFVIVKNPAVGGALYGVAAVSGKEVWAVGYGPTGGTDQHETTLAERWDGSSWKIIPTPHPGRTSELDAVTSGGGAVWAVGVYEGHSTNDSSAGLCERWTGSKWIRITMPGNVIFTTVRAFSNSNVWAAGAAIGVGAGRIVEHWNGADWTQVQDAGVTGTSDDEITSLAGESSGHLFAVGDYNVDGQENSWFEQQAAPWQNFGQPLTNTILRGVSADSATDAWTVGSAINNQGEWPVAVHWDGTTATQINPPAFDTPHQLNAVIAEGPTNVWAVGIRVQEGSNATRTLIDHYTASGWVDLGGPNNAFDDSLNAITAVPGDPSDMWAVGQGGAIQPLILHHPSG